MNRPVTIAALWISLVSPGHGEEIRVTLLGTGDPRPVMEHFGPSVLVEAADEKFIFDVGRGALQRLTQLGIAYDQIDGVFFTHLHSDHVVGFPDLWLTGWLISRRERPLRVFGPLGTRQMLNHLTQAYSFDIAIRIADDGVAESGSQFEVIEVENGFEWSYGDISVRAFDVDHRPVEPAMGYRIEFAGRSVVLSGDTRYSENLIEHAAGIDLIIHEVVGMTEEFMAARPGSERVHEHHTSAWQAGEVFSRVRPKLAVYSHLALYEDYDADRLVADTRQTYDGRVIVGEDLMQFVVGDNIQVTGPATPAAGR
ncbi:MAG: MBL fold metallo-hydrolase [Rhodospirillaceae bacterium]|nr:MBL fold metallo-hydrolase [Rhodospirillaceae bacterium]